METFFKAIDSQSKATILMDTDYSRFDNYTLDLIYLIDGTAKVTVEDTTYEMKRNDIIVINKFERYQIERISDKNIILILEISDTLFMQAVDPDGLKFNCNSVKSSEIQSYEEIQNQAIKIFELILLDEQRASFLYYSEIYKLLNTLVSNYAIYTKFYTKKDSKIRAIIKYIHTHYYENIGLAVVSDKFFMDSGYFSKYFKKNVGTNFKDYVTNIRLFYAERDLRETDDSIAKIATSNGFTNIASFNNAFKKYHNDTPSSYRREHFSPKKDSMNYDQQEVLLRYEHLKGKKEPKDELLGQVNIQLSREGEQILPIWRKIINVGDVEEILGEGLKNHLKAVTKRIPFEYARIGAVFSESMYCDWETGTISNFDRLNEIFDFLFDINIYPWITLNKVDFVNKEPLLINRSIMNWEKILSQFLEYMVNRYDFKQIRKWKFEFVLNDLADNSEVVNYTEFYKVTRNLIKKADRTIEIGGPTLKVDAKLQDFPKNFEKVLMNEFDFHSLMLYPYIRDQREEERNSQRITDPDYVKNRTLVFKSLFSNCPKKRIYITEWNLTVSNRNIINDTLFKGAYLLKNICDVMQLVDGIGYWSVSDWHHASASQSGFLTGGSGLLNKYGMEKPAMFALRFIDELDDNQIFDRGKNYLVVGNEREFYVLYFNYDHPNQLYYLMNERRIKPSDINKFFTGEENKVQINITNIDSGVYELRTFHCDEEHGNLLGLWRDFDYSDKLRISDLKYLKNKNTIRMQLYKESIRRNYYVYEKEVESNEFFILHFRRATEIYQ